MDNMILCEGVCVCVGVWVKRGKCLKTASLSRILLKRAFFSPIPPSPRWLSHWKLLTEECRKFKVSHAEFAYIDFTNSSPK